MKQKVLFSVFVLLCSIQVMAANLVIERYAGAEMVQDIADEPNYHLVINSLEAITEDSYSVSLNDIF